MINKNQYEKSVVLLKNHIPLFVRKTFNSFAICLDELSAELMALAQKNEQPYSIDNICKKLIKEKDFMRAYTSLIHDPYVLKLKLTEICEGSTTGDFTERISKDEEFYTVNGPDIYAPVTIIQAAITPFSAKGTYWSEDNKSGVENDPIPLEFEIVKGSKSVERSASDTSYGVFNTNECIEGFNGVKTVLDDLESKLVVDLKGLFNKYFKMISEGINVDYSPNADKGDIDPTRYVEKIVNIATVAKDAVKASEIVEKITETLYSSVITTYFIFASKLVGAKNDIYQWMYTSFVKDSVSSVDAIDYPTKAPVTFASGHAVSGRPYGIYSERETSCNPELGENVTEQDASFKLNKITIYRNIRMQYSVWASVINAVLDSRLWVEGLRWQNKQTKEWCAANGLKNDSITGSVIRLEAKMIMAYLKAKYRTYNLSQQIDYNSNTPYQSVKNIHYAVDRIKDEEAASMVKEAITGKKIEETLIEVDTSIYNTLALGSIAVNQLSKFVLNGAYCLLMVKMIASLGKAKNNIDPATGRPVKDVFAEIFYGILGNIKLTHKYLSKFDGSYKLDRFSDEMYKILNEVARFYSPIEHDFNLREDNLDDNKYHEVIKTDSFVSESLNKLAERSEKEPVNVIDAEFESSVIDIPLFSDIHNFECELKYSFALDDYEIPTKVIDMHLNSSNEKELFPKNRLVLEGIEKMNFNSHRSFASIESVTQAIDSLEALSELGFEGADAMASNAAYSSLANVCGGITSLEITNEATAEKDHIIIDNDEVIENAKTDPDGNVMAEGTSDALDQANLTHHSIESVHANIQETLELNLHNRASERFNKLFNSVILGLK